eukprot:TRINITY_DN14352_c0_g1_i1.p1 TRINITY_DN14352_c0_g1~~TRINITY_DN14352_c0_g1_i1.p1  ORF type:complete len:267 (-),score=53.65 TRINITY_DN14352_c0_g1_i1:54-854(-)
MNKQSQKLFAIKIIDKEKTYGKDKKMLTQLNREIDILRKIKHPNCVNFYGMTNGQKYLYIYLEYAEGGELFKKISEKGRLTEREARRLFMQLLQAVNYLHKRGIAHRDLKPENILLDKNGNVKVSDFGLARLMEESAMMTTLCGTPQYVAPEVIRIGMPNSDPEVPGYSDKVDMWSLGVTLYLLLTGELPFNGEDRIKLFRNIEEGNYSFPSTLWSGISTEAQDLVVRLLDVNPSTRLTSDEAIEHPWFGGSVVKPLQKQINTTAT